MASFRTEGIAIVTGAANWIGQGVANALAEAGAVAVIFADAYLEGAQAAAENSKKLATNPIYSCQATYIDVTNPEIVAQVVRKAVDMYGRIDYFVNSAGIGSAGYDPIPENKLDFFEKAMDVNSEGTLICSRAVIKFMENQEPRSLVTRAGNHRDLGRGCIVNVTSAASFCAVPGQVATIASNHAAMGVTKATAEDCKGKGIRVNALCPGLIRTPKFEAESQKSPHVQDFIKGTVGRPAEPDEIGESVAYLCSPAASYVNGIGLLADAGLLLTVHIGT
ncbi:MAG: hypothetical protein M1820_008296 [Bogoriella megaspora]|nr:MAG: hypothetical protein M1820_008296 [Bogoriella megaspora]